MDWERDRELKYGQTGQNMKENGTTIKLMGKESFGMQMEMCTKEIGKTIKRMDMEFTFMLMVPNMRDIGKMIYKMDKE